MKLLHELATQVLLGSDRRAPVLPEPGGALGDFLRAACPSDDKETGVLRCAGSLALCAAAGYQPAISEGMLPPECPPEDMTVVDDPQFVSTLCQILDDGPDPLRREAFFLMANKGYCLPSGLLPKTLNLGQKSHELRPAMLAVLGQRGQWLARFNPAWHYTIGADDSAIDLSLWEHGSQEQRKQLLGKLRDNDPDQARTLLQDGFSQLDARERASLLETLKTGLALPDEDFLEALLTDRSKEVRQRAGSLLADLPGSRYGARMAQRMVACLGHERKLLRTAHTLDAPTSFAADWKNDALEESRPKNESLGERAWWLYQLARNLPLSWWEETTGLAPAKLVDWLRTTDWSEAILRAWSEVLQRRPDACWASVFLTQANIVNLSLDIFELLACLPVREREQHCLSMLEGGMQSHTRTQLLARLIENLSLNPAAPSEDFSRRLLAEARQLISKPDYGTYQVCQALPELVSLIPPACFAEACEGWAVAPDYFSTTLARILAIVEQRKILHQILR